jgi:hypothetical protein
MSVEAMDLLTAVAHCLLVILPFRLWKMVSLQLDSWKQAVLPSAVSSSAVEKFGFGSFQTSQ